MKKRIVSLLFTAIFLLACLTPVVGLALTGGAKAGANEVLAAKPALTKRDGSINARFLNDLSDYVGDRFSLRQEAVTAWAGLNAKLFHRSVTDSVLLGRDGWLYYAPTLEDYTRSQPMTERELWCAGRTLFLLQEYVESRGGQFLFTIAPNKNSLYGEHMPDRTVLEGGSNAEALSAVLGDMGVRYLDLFALFRSRPEELYFPTDSHWNGKGAALAADAILSALGRSSDYAAGPFADGTHKGDLYEMLYPAGTGADPDLVYAPGFTFTASSQNPDNISIHTESGGSGRLLLFRDSFGRNLYPYLAESFAAADFSRKNDYGPGEIAPGDAVAVELVERNLRYLNQYAPTLPAPERPAALAAGAVETGESVELHLANGGPVGYTVLHGVWTGSAPGASSPVYLSAGGALYEAVPTPDGFRAAVPETAAAEPMRLVFADESGALLSLTAAMPDA